MPGLARPPVTLEPEAIEDLIRALTADGYSVVGPVVRDGVIALGPVASTADLPSGVTDTQGPGTYRLSQREDEALFGFAVGPDSWKRFLHPPVIRLFQALWKGRGFELAEDEDPVPRAAFLGVRGCELAAIAIQDRALLGGPFVDPLYRARRQQAFLVAVACGRPGGTCFCASMGTGPAPGPGADIAMTEVLRDGRHFFVASPGTERGGALLTRLPGRQTTPDEEEAARQTLEEAARRMGRHLETADLREVLATARENPRWDDAAGRCLACGNCTMVCPTCFCTTFGDVANLDGSAAERVRRWDSCFSAEFSFIHGGTVRPSTRARYRHWLTHKLSAWHDQFGSSGCVGCGRCITWCPPGIDLTEEVQAIRDREQTKEG